MHAVNPSSNSPQAAGSGIIENGTGVVPFASKSENSTSDPAEHPTSAGQFDAVAEAETRNCDPSSKGSIPW